VNTQTARSRIARPRDAQQAIGQVRDGGGFAVVLRRVACGLAEALAQRGIGKQPIDLAGNRWRGPRGDDECATLNGITRSCSKR